MVLAQKAALGSTVGYTRDSTPRRTAVRARRPQGGRLGFRIREEVCWSLLSSEVCGNWARDLSLHKGLKCSSLGLPGLKAEGPSSPKATVSDPAPLPGPISTPGLNRSRPCSALSLMSLHQ